MLDGGGGGGGVSTPWYDYEVSTMWGIVNGQDTERLWQQASGWKNTADLTSMHVFNLKEYKESLAEAWPPERSEASRAYMAELDKLIASVQETHDAAAANYDAVVAMALAVGDAKYKLKPLYEEYQSNQQKLAEYNDLVASNEAMGQAGLMTTTVGDPPVRDGRQQELNNQARSIMYSISSEVTTAGATLKPPTRYVPPPGRSIEEPAGNPTAGGGPAGGAMLVPPVIPPVRPAPPPTPAPPTAPPPPPPPSTQPGLGQGPILGGTPIPAPAPPGTMPPGIQPPPPPTPPPAPGLPPGGLIGPTPPGTVMPKATLPVTGLVNGNGVGPGPKPLGGVAGNVSPRPMPPGGVIGGQPGAGLARPGAGRPVSRINPPGGMIGETAAAGTAGGRPSAPAGVPAAGGRAAATRSGATEKSIPIAQSGRAAQRREEEASVQHWDPDNPWATEEGVAPVVLPPPEPKRPDPGPTIGRGR